VYPVRYEPGFYIPADGIVDSHRREHLKSYKLTCKFGRFYNDDYSDEFIVSLIVDEECSLET
jgi:hypothetical protein